MNIHRRIVEIITDAFPEFKSALVHEKQMREFEEEVKAIVERRIEEARNSATSPPSASAFFSIEPATEKAEFSVHPPLTAESDEDDSIWQKLRDRIEHAIDEDDPGEVLSWLDVAEKLCERGDGRLQLFEKIGLR